MFRGHKKLVCKRLLSIKVQSLQIFQTRCSLDLLYQGESQAQVIHLQILSTPAQKLVQYVAAGWHPKATRWYRTLHSGYRCRNAQMELAWTSLQYKHWERRDYVASRTQSLWLRNFRGSAEGRVWHNARVKALLGLGTFSLVRYATREAEDLLIPSNKVWSPG